MPSQSFEGQSSENPDGKGKPLFSIGDFGVSKETVDQWVKAARATESFIRECKIPAVVKKGTWLAGFGVLAATAERVFRDKDHRLVRGGESGIPTVRAVPGQPLDPRHALSRLDGDADNLAA